jgi:allantoicase
VIIKLAGRGMVQWVEVDTTHFKGNAPESCSLEGMAGGAWKDLMPRQALQAHTRHFFGDEIHRVGPVTHVRFNIFPDGGVARLRVIGKLCRDGLERFNALLPDEARGELLECCGSARWAGRLAAQRPFGSREELFASADTLWWNLEPPDWMEALDHDAAFASREQASEVELRSRAEDKRKITRQKLEKLIGQ